MKELLEKKRLLSVEQSAEYLDLHPDTVRRHLKAGTIPYLKVGRVFRISRKALDDLITEEAKLPVPPRTNANVSAEKS